jgi:hypothetical protein
MAGNGKPQFVRQIFTQQSNGAVGEAVDAAVRQDKGVLTNAPRSTKQPAPLRQAARPDASRTKVVRANKHIPAKVKLVHTTLHLHPLVRAELERRDYSRSMYFQLLGKRTPSWVTLPPDGSVRAEEFLSQTPDPGALTTGSMGSNATAPAMTWGQVCRRYSAGLCP